MLSFKERIKVKAFEKIIRVGDCIVVNTRSTIGFTVGRVYKVSKVDTGTIFVELDDNGSRKNGWSRQCFRKATKFEATAYEMIGAPYNKNNLTEKEQYEILITQLKNEIQYI